MTPLRFSSLCSSTPTAEGVSSELIQSRFESGEEYETFEYSYIQECLFPGNIDNGACIGACLSLFS